MLALPLLLTILSVSLVTGAFGGGIPLLRVPRINPNIPRILSSNISIANSHGFAYLARIDIGNQDFLVLLDTGSSDLWVVSSDCTEEDCQPVPKYRPTSSLKLTGASFDLNYLLGSVSGGVGIETITLGPFQISSQVFALANQTVGLGLSGTGNSGILGLSFPLEASIPDTAGQTLLENLFSPFDDSSRFFAFKLGRDQVSSSFTIGQIDSAFANSTSDFSFTPVYPAFGSTYDYWKIPIQRLTINSTAFELSRSRVKGTPTPIAVMDTGTTLVLGPSDDVDRFWTSIGGARKTDAGWQVRCDRAIIVGFVLGQSDSQKEYFIDPADLSWEEGGREGDWCMGGVQGNDGVSSGDWLLGDTFLRNVYAIHHASVNDQPPKIGLLGMTDPTSAISEFRAARGEDPTPSVPVLSAVPHHASGLGAVAVCGVSGASGFLLGLVLTVVISLCLSPSGSSN